MKKPSHFFQTLGDATIGRREKHLFLFLSNESRGGRALVSPGGRQYALGLVVTSQTMDT